MQSLDARQDDQAAETTVASREGELRPGPEARVTSIKAQSTPGRRRLRRGLILAPLVLAVSLAGLKLFAPSLRRELQTVSTDDAFVNSHFTLVAPRIQGQVDRVLVDDNMRVSKGDLLVQLSREPYQAQVDLKKATVASAESDLKAVTAETRAALGKLRNLCWKLRREVEQVDNSVALLDSRVELVRSREASLDRARTEYRRAEMLLERVSIPREEFDQKRESMKVAEASMREARDEVLEIRASLGLAPAPPKGDLTEVPADIDQTASSVREALSSVVECAAQLGLPWIPATATPKEVLAEFVSTERQAAMDRALDHIVSEAPAVRQAASRRLQAERELAQAELNLAYCEIRAEVDGIVVRRSVNPGNNVAACQSMMVIRSLDEIWIDANFKETQLADMRIGQRAEVEIDMYGGRKIFRGRVTGFSAGTGQTLMLLPPQNATGNFVRVVQRLPVRIELEDYDPQRDTLFAGLSVTPYVYVHESPQGVWAGQHFRGLGMPGATGSK